MPGDLWLAPDGSAHVVWSERAIDERLRERFFPRVAQSHALKYAVVREGKVTERRTLVLAEEGRSDEVPSSPRFHVTSDSQILVVYYVCGHDSAGRPVSENRVLGVHADGRDDPRIRMPLQTPLTRFFTAAERARRS